MDQSNTDSDKSQITPGPWRVESFGHAQFAVIDAEGNSLLFTDLNGNDADARLCAAAPDLKAALEGLLTIGQFALMDPPPPFEEITARYDAARAAIAKAEGR